MTGDVIVTAVIGAISSVGGAGMAWWMLKNEYLDLRREVKDLRDRELAAIAGRVERIETRCTAETNTQAIDSMKPTLARIEDKIGVFTAAVAALQAEQKNTHEYVSHVDGELSSHLHKGTKHA